MPFFVKLHLISDTVTYSDMITMRVREYHGQIHRQVDSYKGKVVVYMQILVHVVQYYIETVFFVSFKLKY